MAVRGPARSMNPACSRCPTATHVPVTLREQAAFPPPAIPEGNTQNERCCRQRLCCHAEARRLHTSSNVPTRVGPSSSFHLEKNRELVSKPQHSAAAFLELKHNRGDCRALTKQKGKTLKRTFQLRAPSLLGFQTDQVLCRFCFQFCFSASYSSPGKRNSVPAKHGP